MSCTAKHSTTLEMNLWKLVRNFANKPYSMSICQSTWFHPYERFLSDARRWNDRRQIDSIQGITRSATEDLK